MATPRKPGARARKLERERVLGELLAALGAVMDPPDIVDPVAASGRFALLSRLYRQYVALTDPPATSLVSAQADQT